MNTFLKFMALYALVSLVCCLLYGWAQYRRGKRERLDQIFDRLDDLDPRVRPLRPEEESERADLLRELEEKHPC